MRAVTFRKLLPLAIAVCLWMTCWPGAAQISSLSAPDLKANDVQLEGEPLFQITQPIGPFSATVRAQATSQRIADIAKDDEVNVNSIRLQQQAESANILLGDQIIATITADDAKAREQSAQALGKAYLQTIRDAIQDYRASRSTERILRGLVYAAVTTVSLIIIVLATGQVFPRYLALLNRWRNTRIPSLRLQRLEIISSDRMTDILIGLSKLGRTLFLFGLVLIYIPTVSSFFPWTRRLGSNFFRYLAKTFEQAGNGFVAYLPNLLIVLLIIAVTYYILRFLRVFLLELGRSDLVSWFYPEWARPTYKLAVFIVIALALVIAYPYLPGFQSPALQGVSLFVGVLFSLGSTAAVANVVAGVILIYTRAFRTGDRVKIGEYVGDIHEKTLLVTRVITPKNVIITIPNSAVLTGNVINYSASIRDAKRPLVLHTTVTLGYDVPWPKVHEVLIQAALATEHILDDPAPFVLQTSLDDFYVSYELNACTKRPGFMPRIYSALHQNIQDRCNEAGIEILSPHYSALRDGHQLAVPEQYWPHNYVPPGFRFDPNRTEP